MIEDNDVGIIVKPTKRKQKMKETQMEEVLKTIGIETSLLNSKPVFTREETEKIFNCTHQTLKKFEKRSWIKPNKFKNRNYYTRADIINCIKIQAPFESTNHQIEGLETIWDIG